MPYAFGIRAVANEAGDDIGVGTPELVDLLSGCGEFRVAIIGGFGRERRKVIHKATDRLWRERRRGTPNILP
jgi:hypothetical protein